MNLEEFRTWQDGVCEHIRMLDQMVDDRKILKEIIEKHLKQFFDYDDIEYDREFNKITLKWDKGTSPVIKNDMIADLHMDWIIRADYDDNAFRVVVVEVYPFGLDEGET